MSEAQGIHARIAALKAELDGALARIKLDDDTASDFARLEKEARRVVEEAAGAVSDAGKKAEAYVAERPFTGIAAALLAGIVIGALWRRR